MKEDEMGCHITETREIKAYKRI